MILVFDLDDTLYEEISYVKSSFTAVANYLAEKFNLSEDILFQELFSVMEKEGRGHVFDYVLKKNNIFSKTEVKKCLMIYRKNYPDISLTDDAQDCLKRFVHLPKYLVTDGNKIVQKIKINALGLNPYFKKIIRTHTYGKSKAKPATHIFHKIVEWENTNPWNLVYIGDNPYKDFINLKKENFKTIRILRGNFKRIKLSEEYEADVSINTLYELDDELLKKLIGNK